MVQGKFCAFLLERSLMEKDKLQGRPYRQAPGLLRSMLVINMDVGGAS